MDLKKIVVRALVTAVQAVLAVLVAAGTKHEKEYSFTVRMDSCYGYHYAVCPAEHEL